MAQCATGNNDIDNTDDVTLGLKYANYPILASAKDLYDLMIYGKRAIELAKKSKEECKSIENEVGNPDIDYKEPLQALNWKLMADCKTDDAKLQSSQNEPYCDWSKKGNTEMMLAITTDTNHAFNDKPQGSGDSIATQIENEFGRAIKNGLNNICIKNEIIRLNHILATRKHANISSNSKKEASSHVLASMVKLSNLILHCQGLTNLYFLMHGEYDMIDFPDNCKVLRDLLPSKMPDTILTNFGNSYEKSIGKVDNIIMTMKLESSSVVDSVISMLEGKNCQNFIECLQSHGDNLIFKPGKRKRPLTGVTARVRNGGNEVKNWILSKEEWKGIVTCFEILSWVHSTGATAILHDLNRMVIFRYSDPVAFICVDKINGIMHALAYPLWYSKQNVKTINEYDNYDAYNNSKDDNDDDDGSGNNNSKIVYLYDGSMKTIAKYRGVDSSHGENARIMAQQLSNQLNNKLNESKQNKTQKMTFFEKKEKNEDFEVSSSSSFLHRSKGLSIKGMKYFYKKARMDVTGHIHTVTTPPSINMENVYGDELTYYCDGFNENINRSDVSWIMTKNLTFLNGTMLWKQRNVQFYSCQYMVNIGGVSKTIDSWDTIKMIVNEYGRVITIVVGVNSETLKKLNENEKETFENESTIQCAVACAVGLGCVSIVITDNQDAILARCFPNFKENDRKVNVLFSKKLTIENGLTPWHYVFYIAAHSIYYEYSIHDKLKDNNEEMSESKESENKNEDENKDDSQSQSQSQSQEKKLKDNRIVNSDDSDDGDDSDDSDDSDDTTQTITASFHVLCKYMRHNGGQTWKLYSRECDKYFYLKFGSDMRVYEDEIRQQAILDEYENMVNVSQIENKKHLLPSFFKQCEIFDWDYRNRTLECFEYGLLTIESGIPLSLWNDTTVIKDKNEYLSIIKKMENESNELKTKHNINPHCDVAPRNILISKIDNSDNNDKNGEKYQCKLIDWEQGKFQKIDLDSIEYPRKIEEEPTMSTIKFDMNKKYQLVDLLFDLLDDESWPIE